MIEIFLALVLGLFIGKLIRKYGLSKQIGYFTLAGVMGLLFVMGALIGSNPEVLLNLPTLGGQALLLAVFCSLGSVLLSLPLGLGKK